MRETSSSSDAMVPQRLRPLKWNELVRQGDFVEDGRQGFEPWMGPSGFRADTYVKAIYRKLTREPASLRKTR
jgi:hypothetical protein